MKSERLYAILTPLAGLLLACLTPILAFSQTYAPVPPLRTCFYDSNGAPLAGGKVYSYQATTSNPLNTWTDSTGGSQNVNPTILDTAGCAQIWVNNAAYKFIVQDANSVPQFTVDGVTEAGLSALAKAVLLAPAGGAEQDVTGVVGATSFKGTSAHTTSSGVRVAILDPTTVLDSASNPPNMVVISPSVAALNYIVPDPAKRANFVLSPQAAGNANLLDCTDSTSLTCKRQAYLYFDGAGCNNTTPGLAWDTFGSNSPTPICITGTNLQKGVMAFPSAVTPTQSNTGFAAGAGTCSTTYPSATTTGQLLVAEVAVDGGKTVAGITDTTNAYTLAKAQANGNFDVEIWYFNGNSTGMPAGTTLTVTLSGVANCSFSWQAYSDALTAAMLDKVAGNTGTGTAVTTGNTVGTTQNVELVLAAVAAATNPTITAGTGFSPHPGVTQATVSMASEGKIQQTTAVQSGTFTLGSSQIWAAAIATFKANVGQAASAFRSFTLPTTYRAADPATATIKWQAPLLAIGSVTTHLNAFVVCTADGSTDDNVFNAPASAAAPVPTTAANTLTSTILTPLVTTGCNASNQMHFAIQRDRYATDDTFEGYVYVNGASIVYGITQ